MKFVLAQINTTVGDFAGNVKAVKKGIGWAEREGADLVVFPEMAVCGYPPRDLVERPSFIAENVTAAHEAAKAARGITALFGFIDRNPVAGAKPLFNAAAVAADGKIRSVYHKMLLPTYDVFDEGRTFEPGSQPGLIEVAGKKIGITICEDIWNDKLFWANRQYARDPVEECVGRGAEAIVCLSASPFHAGKAELRAQMLEALGLRHAVPFVFVNLVGGNDELVFDGLSEVADSRGRLVLRTEPFQEDCVLWDDSGRAGLVAPLPHQTEAIHDALVLGTRDYVKKCGFKKVIVGLSGGIDSSVVAALAAAAVGPKNVTGVAMPSVFSSHESLVDARGLAKNLKIRFQTIPISSIVRSYRTGLKGILSDSKVGLPEQNIQARIRGNILMALSNKEGSLLLSTGNKSEMGVGYCTLYGDMSGGLAVISDLPKTLVYEVARFMNRQEAVIPERVFTKAPTAELKPDQTDQDDLPPYEELDTILKAYVEEHKTEAEIIGEGLEPVTVRDIIRRINANEYKRRQAAPGIRVTSRAFGIGRRYPIARKY